MAEKKPTNSLMAQLMSAAGKNSRATVLDQSDFFEKEVLCQTGVPIVDIMLGGSLDGGVTPGITILLGDSRTFKTNMCLLQVAAFMKKYPEAVCAFFDCEFGATKYFDTFGIDKSRVIHCPIENIEEMKFQVVKMLDSIEPGQKVIFLIDSVSQIASVKEVENALEEKATRDMTRAQELNSFWRMITPKLALRKIPLFAINSFYDEIGNDYAEPVMKGGKQGFLSADAIWFTTRSQEKKDKDLLGWNFNYTMMKSRFAKEKSKMTVTVLYDGGIQKYSGMLELAREAGFVALHGNGWYAHTDAVDANVRQEKKFMKAQLHEAGMDAWWDAILSNLNFREFVKNKFSFEGGPIMEEVDPETGEITGGNTK